MGYHVLTSWCTSVQLNVDIYNCGVTVSPICKVAINYTEVIACRHFDRQVLLVSYWLVVLLLGCSVQFCS